MLYNLTFLGLHGKRHFYFSNSMNADREVLLEEALQKTLTQLKSHVWADIDALASSGSLAPEQVFQSSQLDLEHIQLLNSMLTTVKDVTAEKCEPKKCEDAVEFRRISAFFQSNAERFLMESPVYTYNFKQLIPELNSVLGQIVSFTDGFLPFISIPVADIFTVKIIFSLENQPAFVVVHSSAEIEKSQFEQSDFRVFRTLGVYFSRVLPDFIMKYKSRGIIEFAIWLKSYKNLFSATCSKCEQFISRDLTGDLLPPIIRTVTTCQPYHIRCAPFEIELPDFGYVTLMSEDQMQEKISHSIK